MISIIYGDEPYIIEKWIQKQGSNSNEWNTSYFEELTEEVFDLAKQYPFMSYKRVIVVKIKTLGNNEAFLSYLENPLDSTDLILVPQTIDKRSNVYKRCKKLNLLKECNKLNDALLRKFVGNLVQLQNGIISEEMYLYFIQRIGYFSDERVTLYDVVNAIKQLLFSSKEVTEEIISTLVEESFHEKTYVLTKYLFQKDTKQLFYHLERFLQEGESPIGMLSLVLRNFRILYKKYLYADQKDISNQLGISSYQLNQIGFCNKIQAENAIQLLQNGVNMIKNGNDGRIVMISVLSKIVTILS